MKKHLTSDQTSIHREATRREFIASCAVLSMLSVRGARGQTLQETPQQSQRVLLGLIRTLLPCEHPRFPRLSTEQLRSRLQVLFPFQEHEEREAFDRALVIFDRVSLFLDRRAMVRDDDLADRDWDLAVAEERRAFEHWREARGLPDHFRELSLEDQRGYLTLWARSRCTVRRRFYRSTKAMVMATAYSMDEVWTSIGYEGPLLRRLP